MYLDMRLVRKYDEGGKTGNPGDAKSSFITRAKGLTGRELAGMENLKGLDYERLQTMSDDEMKSLLDLVNRLKPEDKSDVGGGIKKSMENLGEIKDVVGGLREKYGLDTKKLIDSILKERDTGYIKSKMIKGAASVAGLYAGGGLLKLRKGGFY